MTSIAIPGRTGRPANPRFAGLRPLIRKDIAEWTHGPRPWIVLAVTTVFLALTAANAAITTWVTTNVPGAVSGPREISVDPVANFVTAVATQFFIVVAIFATMSLLVGERERGTLAWVASKPVSRGAIWLSKFGTSVMVVAVVGGLIPVLVTFGLVAGLYGSAGVGALVVVLLGVIASISFIIAVVLAASAFVPNQAAVAAIGFAAFFLPQILVGLSPINIEAFLPASILGWTVALSQGADVGIATPVAWAISIVVLAGIAIRRMDAIEL